MPASVCERCVSTSSTPQNRVVTLTHPRVDWIFGENEGRGLAADCCNGTASLIEVS